LFEYIDGGSYAEVTLRRNITDLHRVALRQRVLRDVSSIDLTTTLLGQQLSMPIILAPVGLAGFNARRGEVQAARAAEAKGTRFCLSTVSACSIAEVAAGLKAPFWFQLYMMKDRGFMSDVLARANQAGCSALVFTVDLPIAGARYRDVRSGLSGAPGWPGKLRRGAQMLTQPIWMVDVGLLGRPHSFGNLAHLFGSRSRLEDFFGWIADNFDASVTWSDLAALRNAWKGPLIVKGILDAEDARLAAAIGVDGIVVSNHGGRQLDGVPSSAAALPAIAEAVGDRLTILADGGVRSGLDAVRLIALGARAVLIGRPWIYALAARGQDGVAHVLELMAAEMRVAMALTGCRRIAEIGADALVPEILSASR
jgi:L-lactate dehydrogenase (cytochrome)